MFLCLELCKVIQFSMPWPECWFMPAINGKIRMNSNEKRNCRPAGFFWARFIRIVIDKIHSMNPRIDDDGIRGHCMENDIEWRCGVLIKQKCVLWLY